VLITATSFSFRFQVTIASQTVPVSSFQLVPSLLMMRDVGGGAGRPGPSAGRKGGGFWPPCGPLGSETMSAGRIIERLPDSKIAT
jgi:hypothetical protein